MKCLKCLNGLLPHRVFASVESNTFSALPSFYAHRSPAREACPSQFDALENFYQIKSNSAFQGKKRQKKAKKAKKRKKRQKRQKKQKKAKCQTWIWISSRLRPWDRRRCARTLVGVPWDRRRCARTSVGAIV